VGAARLGRNLTSGLFADRPTRDDGGSPIRDDGGWQGRPEEDWGAMRINRGLLGWGVFFIVLGAVPLAVRAGALDRDLVGRAWELWPLILVGIGLGLVLERTRLAVVGSVVVAVTFGLMGGALVATGVGSPVGFTTCGSTGSGDRGEPFAAGGGLLGADTQVRLDFSCGELVATAVDGSQWKLDGRSAGGQPPEIGTTSSGLVLRTPSRTGINLGSEAWRWNLSLPRAGAISVGMSLNAGSADIRLDGITVPAFDVSVNAGDARVDLGQAAGTTTVGGSVNAGSLAITLPRPTGILDGSLSVNVGSLELCVAAGTPIRLRTGDSPLGSNNFASRGLVRTGNTWISDGFDGAADAVDLRISTNLGSVTLNPENGCE
jgi:hypothetical protein